MEEHHDWKYECKSSLLWCRLSAVEWALRISILVTDETYLEKAPPTSLRAACPSLSGNLLLTLKKYIIV